MPARETQRATECFFRPNCAVPDSDTETATNLRNQPKLFINLNPVERETWRRILAARTVAEIAKEEGTSRAAIYARIRGNRLGQGGNDREEPVGVAVVAFTAKAPYTASPR